MQPGCPVFVSAANPVLGHVADVAVQHNSRTKANVVVSYWHQRSWCLHASFKSTLSVGVWSRHTAAGTEGLTLAIEARGRPRFL